VRRRADFLCRRGRESQDHERTGADAGCPSHQSTS
jgi:hypothetical protein